MTDFPLKMKEMTFKAAVWTDRIEERTPHEG